MRSEQTREHGGKGTKKGKDKEGSCVRKRFRFKQVGTRQGDVTCQGLGEASETTPGLRSHLW